MKYRGALAVALVAACRDAPASRAPVRAPGPSAIARAVSRTIAAQLHRDMAVTCAAILGLPTRCTATLPDGTALPIALRWDAAARPPGWQIELATPAIATAPIAAYVTDELADLGVTDTARCGPAFVPLPDDLALACALGHGGTAIVALDATGAIVDLELALDPAAAHARTDAPPPDLAARSSALSHTEDDDDESDRAR